MHRGTFHTLWVFEQTYCWSPNRPTAGRQTNLLLVIKQTYRCSPNRPTVVRQTGLTISFKGLYLPL